MKKQCRSYADFDLSRYHILSFDEMLKVNGGWGKKTSDDGSSSKSKDKSKDKGKSGSGRTDTKSNAASSKSSRGSAASQKDGKSGTKASSKSETGKKSESSANSKSKPKEVANTHEAVAKANVGDTVTRNDGTKVKLTKGDIDWAKDKCSSGSSKQSSKKNSGGSSSSSSSRDKRDSSVSPVAKDKAGKCSSENAGKLADASARKNEPENRPAVEAAGKNETAQSVSSAKTPEQNSGDVSSEQKVEEAKKSPATENGSDTGEIATADGKNQQNEISIDAAQNNAETELAAKKTSELNQPKSESILDKIMNVFNTTNTSTVYAGDVAGKLAKTDLQAASVLNDFSEKMSKAGNVVVALDFANTTYNNAKAYENGEMSYWQSAYNTVTHGIAVTAGAGAYGFITAAGTMETLGLGTVPAAAAGTIAAAGVSKVIDWGFDWIEEKIWGVAK